MVLRFIIIELNLIVTSLFKRKYKMAKQTFQSNPRVQQIFEDLEKYLEFCVDFGYKYNEAELYDQRSYVYRQYTKFATGKVARDQWQENARP